MANPESHRRAQFPPSRESQQETRADIPVVKDDPPARPPARALPPPPVQVEPGKTYSYPPLPPPPAPQLPDFKPRGMSAIDKFLAWLMAFVILIFGLIVAAHFLLMPASSKTPSPAVTHSSSTHHASTKAKVAACPSTGT